MDKDFWKNGRYKNKWKDSTERENALRDYLMYRTKRNISLVGLGAGTTDYISGSARENGHEKGDPDLRVDGTNIYIEVTGPLTDKVGVTKPLWFRPDKINNAVRHPEHDVFLAHHCMAANLWRVVHVDEEFKRRFRAYEFPVTTPVIDGCRERYIEVSAKDGCLRDLEYLINYIRQSPV